MSEIEIKPTYVTFLQAKQLKELGFINGTKNVFFEYKDGEIQTDEDYFTINNSKESDLSNKNFTVYFSIFFCVGIS